MNAPTSPWWRNFGALRPQAATKLTEADLDAAIRSNRDLANDAWETPITYVGPTRLDRAIDALWWAAAALMIVGFLAWISVGAPTL